jgi:hypothetical protein
MQQICSLLDHPVGDAEQRRRHVEPEHPGGLGIEDQLELARLHDRQVRGLGALEDTTGIDANLTIPIHNIGSVAHQPTGFDAFTQPIAEDKDEDGDAEPDDRWGQSSSRPTSWKSFRRCAESCRPSVGCRDIYGRMLARKLGVGKLLPVTMPRAQCRPEPEQAHVQPLVAAFASG